MAVTSVDVASVLKEGTATPYLAIFDSDGIPVKNTLTGMPLGAYLTNFTFMFDEEKEDLATLVFDTGDPNTLDLKALQEGSNIFVQWGYIYHDGTAYCSPVRSIEIRDVEAKFDDLGTHVTLKCIDGVNRLRKMPPVKPTDNGHDGMSDYLIKGCDIDLGIIIEKF